MSKDNGEKNAEMKKLPLPVRYMKLNAWERAVTFKIIEGTGGWIARNINKRFSLPVSLVLARKQVSPNSITVFNLLLGIATAVIAAFGGYLAIALAGILFQVVSVIDGVDGEVAKFNNRTTRFGAWLDTVGDNLSLVLFLVGIGVGLYQHTHGRWILNLATLSLIAFAVIISIMASYLVRTKKQSGSLVTYEKEVINVLFKEKNTLFAKSIMTLKYLVKKDFFAFLFFSLCLFNLPELIIILFASVATFEACLLSAITWKMSRQEKAVEDVTELAP